MKQRMILASLLMLVLLMSMSVPAFATDPNVVTIPDYTTAEYAIPFAYTLDAIDALKAPCSEQGTVVERSYTAPAYAVNALLGKDETIDKTVQIYLPYGYDKTKSYNTLYLLHGTGGKDTYWFFTAEPETTCNVLDNMIQQGICEPLIVVTPEYPSELKGKSNKISNELVLAYAEDNADNYLLVRNDLWTQFFGQELRNDIMPLVESEFSTWACHDVSEESLSASREHRAIAGLSRGSMAAMRAGMVQNRDVFAWIGNYSGIWLDLDKLSETLRAEDYPILFWYNGTGTEDFAAENHLTFHNNATAELSGFFTDGENYAMIVKEGGAHDYASWIVDLYNSLLVFFK